MRGYCLIVLPLLLSIPDSSGPARAPESLEARSLKSRFISVNACAGWERQRVEGSGDVVFTSPELECGIRWNELIVSWNAPSSATRRLVIEAQAVFDDRASKWFVMGRWSDDPAMNPRESVKNQKDADGDVDTDTLVLVRPATRLRLRITIGGMTAADFEPPDFVGVSLLDTTAPAVHGKSVRSAWGRSLDVPERSQLSYEGGKVWCCPASTSMVIGYWAKKLARPELDRDVPTVAKSVFDPNWPGTGNWPFNTAFAGSLPGMRAYVTRLAGLQDLEKWVRAGVPVVCSVSYQLLYNVPKSQSAGHVVVCRGFTNEGDAIINDPWADFSKGDKVRAVIPRKQMMAAWAKSKNTVFLIYPKGWKIPVSKGGAWEAGPAVPRPLADPSQSLSRAN